MTMSEFSDAIQSISSSTCTADDFEECKQIATHVVNNLLTRAIEMVKAVEMTELSESLQLDNHAHSHPHAQNQHHQSLVEKPTTLALPPAIQIDLCGSKTPTPDNAFEYWSKRSELTSVNIDENTQITDKNEEDDRVELSPHNECQENYGENDEKSKANTNVNSSENLAKGILTENSEFETLDEDEIREFAKEYVNSLIETALEMSKTQVGTMKTSLTFDERLRSEEFIPWYLRLRETLTRLMRSTCLCKAKQHFRFRKT